jgi:hypothetical protein
MASTNRKKLSTAKSFPKFKLKWKQTADAVLEDTRHGSVRHRIVVSSTGAPLYDCVQVIEPGGAICLPINENDEVALELMYRPTVLKDRTKGKYPNYEAADFGLLLWEAPRGFRDPGEPVSRTSFREVEEETNLTFKRQRHVGQVFMNTAVLPVPIDLFIAKVTGIPKPQKSEGIERIEFFRAKAIREMIQNGQIRCGLTLAVLAHAFARGDLK